MGRWTQYDEDAYRLPEGMKRIGYDADSSRYYFQDTDGSFWRGPEGSELGELTRVAELPSHIAGGGALEHDDLEAAPTHSNGYQLLGADPNSTMAHKPRININASAYRTLFPFFLIIAVVLLLVWRLVLSPGLSAREPCPPETQPYFVEPGDSCWDISKAHGISLDKLQTLNPKLQCDPLMPGSTVCLPQNI
ncbi:hypothetical protein AGABI2DRAFT_175659 [Agaricus bisporus var. bisporus H97]|uniref:hypothetical protein n=1 Tax=Agaricus bisporus var. bisporus (strain H97 / ATCC MYA-4626 / FGSC 10389) TaxID=936046 RepID=UPI00029F5C2F|nr:hypothetical protein AGABI2DRAFT_175659 [Agaricus bisporus var. bisporus H97]EKV50927.1 hypothetical protein AGABI2DRAFT_175659 [Agaricus bisporus var. bisporus H97]